MNRTEFLSLSVAIHAILLAAAFLMPAPFPSPKLPKYPEELLYVQPVNLEARPDVYHHTGTTAAYLSPGRRQETAKADKDFGPKVAIAAPPSGQGAASPAVIAHPAPAPAAPSRATVHTIGRATRRRDTCSTCSTIRTVSLFPCGLSRS